MNKKLIALAIAGVVAAPAALAESANPVTLYGLVDVAFDSARSSGGATVSTRNRVTNQFSRLGVRGTEDLGGGLKAFFQIESQVNPDDACGQGGNPATGTLPNGGCAIGTNNGKGLGSRNSAVGLQGGFGSVLLGRWDTPYKIATISLDPWGDVTNAAYSNIMHDRGNFDRRENNAVQYWTPSLSGFSARVHYSANEAKNAGINPSTVSFSGTYARGPFTIVAAYEKHNDQLGAGAVQGVDEKGTEIGGSFKIGGLKLGLMFEKIKKTGLSDQKNAYASAAFDMGKVQWVGTYGKSKEGLASGALQPDSKSASIGVKYNMSKRTMVYSVYTSVKNNGSALVSNLGNSLGGVGPNSQPKALAVGIQHTF